MNELKYVDPKADLTFKKVFGEHPDLITSLLNALLPLPEDGQIVSIEYLPPEIVPDDPLHKDSIVDVRCKDQNGRQFIVEMQMIWSPDYNQRALFNAAKAYSRELPAGGNYRNLKTVYSLNLLNDNLDLDVPQWYHPLPSGTSRGQGRDDRRDSACFRRAQEVHAAHLAGAENGGAVASFPYGDQR